MYRKKSLPWIPVICLALLCSCGQNGAESHLKNAAPAVETQKGTKSPDRDAAESKQVKDNTLQDKNSSQSAAKSKPQGATDYQDTEILNQKRETAAEAVSSFASSKKETTQITISAAGDCTFGSDRSSPVAYNFYTVYNRKKNPAYFFKNVKKYFKADDLTLVNLEGVLTNRGVRQPKTYAFRGKPSYVNILKKGSIEAVSFANNHCQDFGSVSYTDTRKILDKAGIKYASYGKTAIYRTKGKKIGMVAVNGLMGTDSSKQYILSGIKKLKKRKADLIIVSMHSGIEHTSVLNSVQTQLAHFAVDHGANLVLGHHPHVLQGIERYKGVYIVYSLANFCFGGNTNPSDKDTMIFQQTFTFQGKKLKKTRDAKIIPCCVSSTYAVNDYQPTPMHKKGRKRVISRMNSYSRRLGVTLHAGGKIE